MNISHGWVNWVISIDGRCDKSLNLHWVSNCKYKIYIITHLISENSNLYITQTIIKRFYEEIIFYFYNLGIIKEWFREIWCLIKRAMIRTRHRSKRYLKAWKLKWCHNQKTRRKKSVIECAKENKRNYGWYEIRCHSSDRILFVR